MKATKPEKHLLLPVRSSNIRNHIVNLPATLLLRGGFLVISPQLSHYKFTITGTSFAVRGFSSFRLLFFVLHSLFFVFCLLLFIHRLSLFFCRFLFHVCLLCMYFCRLFFLFCLFPFFVYNKYSFFAGNLRKWKTFCFCKIKGIACLEKKKICKSEYFAFCVEVKVFYFEKL